MNWTSGLVATSISFVFNVLVIALAVIRGVYYPGEKGRRQEAGWMGVWIVGDLACGGLLMWGFFGVWMMPSMKENGEWSWDSVRAAWMMFAGW